MSDVVRVEVADRVATVTLNRPEKLNAISGAVFAGLEAAATRVASDPQVRAVLLRGEGRAFSAGLDLGAIRSFGTGEAPHDLGGGGGAGGGEARGGRDPQASFRAWATMPKPVVALVQGYALGAGFQLALAADIRLAATDAVMSVFEITYGLVPDLGGTQILPRLVGPSRAKELIWTARRITAEEALSWGIVSRVVEADELEAEGRALASDLACRPPLPIAFTKELVGLAGRVSLEEGMRRELEAQARCLASRDMREAVAAAFEKRPGSYTGS